MIHHASPEGVTQEHWDAAAKHAGLGVGHIWFDVRCPAYRSLDPKDCDCQTAGRQY